MIIVGVLNTLEKLVGNFMGILPGDMKEKRLDLPNHKLIYLR
jgi:hypothetical protein